MPTAGPNLPSAAASLANAGTSENANAWASPANIYGAGSASITASTFDSPDISEILVASGFGFSVSGPVTGITVVINKRGYTSTDSGKDFRVQLSTTTAFSGLVGSNKATATVWPATTLADTTYGGASDTWSASLTAAQVNSTGFAVFVSAYANVANADIDVNSITVTITTATALDVNVTAAAGTGAVTNAAANAGPAAAAATGTGAASNAAFTRTTSPAVISATGTGMAANAAASAKSNTAAATGTGAAANAVASLAVAVAPAAGTGAASNATVTGAVAWGAWSTTFSNPIASSLNINVEVVGAGGEAYSGFVKGKDAQGLAPPPKFKILDADGKLIASGQLDYG